MEHQLWDLFRETGDPVGYLFYRAELERKQNRKAQTPEETTPKDRRGEGKTSPPLL